MVLLGTFKPDTQQALRYANKLLTEQEFAVSIKSKGVILIAIYTILIPIYTILMPIIVSGERAMNTAKDTSIAELADKLMQRMALMMLLLCLALAASVIERIVVEHTAWYLNQVEKWSVILLSAMVLSGFIPLVIKKTSMKSRMRPLQMEGFINDIAPKSFLLRGLQHS